MFPSEIKPKNVSFLQLNATNGLPFPDDTFDYVFVRWLTTAFTEEQWKSAILPELVRVCKPGGWIEVIILNMNIYMRECLIVLILMGFFDVNISWVNQI